MTVSDSSIEAAAQAIRDGELVVYPTETVYGLGGDAVDADAIDAVFTVKQRSRSNPLSLAVPTVEAALPYIQISGVEHRFMRAFLPGPITVVCAKREAVPDALTGGRDRVGIRVPDHPVATALLDDVAPITATSANLSGAGSVRSVEDLDASVRSAVAVVLDAGTTPGMESTVVDVANEEIIRAGAMADAVRSWLDEA